MEFAPHTGPDRVAGSQSSGKVYFDASAWSDLVREPDREALVARLKRRPALVLASVISAGEILRTSDALLRQDLSSTIIESIEVGQGCDRTAALHRLRAGIASMNFCSSGLLPSRDERHDRL